MCSETTPVPEIIRQSWPHFAHFHANDCNLKGPGFGKVDFRPIAAALKEGGLLRLRVGPKSFNSKKGPEAIAKRSLEYLRKVFANGA